MRGGAGGAGGSAAVLMIIATKKGIVSEIVDAIPLIFYSRLPSSVGRIAVTVCSAAAQLVR